MLNFANELVTTPEIDIGPTEFLSCNFNELFGTALSRDSFEQLSQFLRV